MTQEDLDRQTQKAAKSFDPVRFAADYELFRRELKRVFFIMEECYKELNHQQNFRPFDSFNSSILNINEDSVSLYYFASSALNGNAEHSMYLIPFKFFGLGKDDIKALLEVDIKSQRKKNND